MPPLPPLCCSRSGAWGLCALTFLSPLSLTHSITQPTSHTIIASSNLCYCWNTHTPPVHTYYYLSRSVPCSLCLSTSSTTVYHSTHTCSLEPHNTPRIVIHRRLQNEKGQQVRLNLKEYKYISSCRPFCSCCCVSLRRPSPSRGDGGAIAWLVLNFEHPVFDPALGRLQASTRGGTCAWRLEMLRYGWWLGDCEGTVQIAYTIPRADHDDFMDMHIVQYCIKTTAPPPITSVRLSKPCSATGVHLNLHAGGSSLVCQHPVALCFRSWGRACRVGGGYCTTACGEYAGLGRFGAGTVSQSACQLCSSMGSIARVEEHDVKLQSP